VLVGRQNIREIGMGEELRGMTAIAGLTLIPTGVRAFAQQNTAPPSSYISKNACPFECCKYGKWIARRPLVLLDRPEGRPVAQIREREQVLAITGEVHTYPLLFKVRRDGPYDDGVPAGSIVYLLHPVGEGFWLVWFKGKVVQAAPGYNGEGPRYRWWANVKTQAGQIGWVLMSVADLPFDNVDGCG
jgi:hypothetical protein